MRITKLLLCGAALLAVIAGCGGGDEDDNLPQTYLVTVVSEGTGASGDGYYAVGETVNIDAGTPPEGYRFSKWTASSLNTVIFANANQAKTHFIMPAYVSSVTVTANFELLDGDFTDTRDGQTYRTVMIGGKRWMAENLNYEMPSSWCYDDEHSNCDIYGRLYDWWAANLACPGGWRLPAYQDWYNMIITVGSVGNAMRLKAAPPIWNGIDSHGFSALPGGFRNYEGESFHYVSVQGNWWTSTEEQLERNFAHNISMATADAEANGGITSYRKSFGFSVRCIMN